MRGPLFSGAIGSAATLERVTALIAASQARAREKVPDRGEQGPVVVLSTVWLGEALSSSCSVLLIVEPENLKAAVRARKRATRRKATGTGGDLQVAVAGEGLPLRHSGVEVLVVEAVTELEAQDARAYVASLAPYLAPAGVIIALDGTRDAGSEAQLSQHFLAARLIDIGQERPRDGAVVTMGSAPPVGILLGVLLGG